MAYTPNEWACGDVIAANKLNSIERGIAEVNGEYVPTEWECGDVITADRMNHIEQGIANAGGGSSDFSTAEITLTDTEGNAVISNLIIVFPDGLNTISVRTTQGTFSHTILLYKGETPVSFQTAEAITEYSGAFSIEESEQDGDVWLTDAIITGDCEVTFKGSGVNF